MSDHPAAPSPESHSDSTVAASRAQAPIQPFAIGAYHLVQVVGRGGMGEVWLAEQQQPVRRRVAIKLIKPGMDTREFVARFESERQALAVMDHPSIAKVFDAGSTPDGRPFFVMEYVSGIPITSYCDKHMLSTRERLALFIRVCEAVQHAHQKAIIHRDLKPSNILVSEVDGQPAPKVIDFGVAKALSHSLGDTPLVTRVGSVVGTLEYMSPEQADSSGEDVDTRADIYSLGVILYELLAGALPLDCTGLSLSELLQKLRATDPQRPSARLSASSEGSTEIAARRRTQVTALKRQLQGDLDAITLKALEKDRRHRYATPAELSADITRFLLNEPVSARHSTASYRAGKYIMRHRLAVFSGVVVVVLLCSFAAVQALQLRRITREKERADRITEFMVNMFRVSDPHRARGRTITAREILDEASKNIAKDSSIDREVRASLSHVMGRVYSGLGEYPQAESLLNASVKLRQDLLGPAHPDTLESVRAYARTLTQQGRLEEGASVEEQALAKSRSQLGLKHLTTLGLAHDLASSLAGLGRYAEAETLLRETSQYNRSALRPEENGVLRTSESAARVLFEQGRYIEAEKMLRALVEGHRRGCGADSPCMLTAKGNLAMALGHIHSLEEGERLLREMLETQKRVMGAEHPQTARTYYNLACLAARGGKRESAIELLRYAIDHGLGDMERRYAKTDIDFESLRSDGRFIALVNGVNKKKLP